LILALAAHAKLNLNLEVLGARPDGSHEVRTLYQAITLHDLLIAERAEETSLEGGWGEADLVLKAQRTLAAAAGRPLPARMRLEKRIPAGAGLGGGSSNAAVALRALSRLYGIALDLEPVAAAVGADVPFFLRGGAAYGTGRGERLSAAPIACGWYTIAWPDLSVSTAAVYARWDDVGGAGPNHLARAAYAVEPRLEAFAERLGPGWTLTGSGSAFFRASPTRHEAEIARRGLDCWTAVARPVGAWA
jgi:4-diphosphocytidyl-2-C-methyl-D-erythritol kinase